MPVKSFRMLWAFNGFRQDLSERMIRKKKSWTIHYAIVCLKELSVKGAREDSWAIFVCWNYALDWRLKLELGTQVNYESDVRHIALKLLAWREWLSSSICHIHLPFFEGLWTYRHTYFSSYLTQCNFLLGSQFSRSLQLYLLSLKKRSNLRKPRANITYKYPSNTHLPKQQVFL